MRVIIQRVKNAKVEIDNNIFSQINNGLLIFAGFENLDEEEDIEWIANKIINLRIFSDKQDKMNLNINDVNGEILVVSQFTLHASTKKGNRPSFTKSASPDKAISLYNKFVEVLQTKYGKKIQTGSFGAMMQVYIQNDGPVTIFMDSKNKE